jgi:hypothetical protein
MMTIKVNVKVKVFLRLTSYELRHENQWWSGCIDLYFIELGNS